MPLSPGGLGIGHLVFERLFSLIGVASGGANVFNVVFFGQLSLNLLGFFPYILLRREPELFLKPGMKGTAAAPLACSDSGAV